MKSNQYNSMKKIFLNPPQNCLCRDDVSIDKWESGNLVGVLNRLNLIHPAFFIRNLIFRNLMVNPAVNNDPEIWQRTPIYMYHMELISLLFKPGLINGWFFFLNCTVVTYALFLKIWLLLCNRTLFPQTINQFFVSEEIIFCKI